MFVPVVSKAIRGGVWGQLFFFDNTSPFDSPMSSFQNVLDDISIMNINEHKREGGCREMYGIPLYQI